MSITDELKEYARHLHNVWYDPLGSVYTYTTMDIAPSLDAVRLDEHVLAIADRIDAEHERALDEQFRALTTDMKPMTDESMAEHGWVRLPVDADGEYIRIGERVQLIGNDPSTVSHMSLANDGWRVYVKYDGGNGTGSGEPKRIRHHAPTVEDMLLEYHERMEELGTTDDCVGVDRAEAVRCLLRDRNELTTEYAAKLRLAGDAE